MKTSIYTQKGELKSSIISAINLINYSKKTKTHVYIYPKSWTRSKGHHNLIDKSSSVLMLLNNYGVRYTEGNDAPRGGAEGDYIRITIKGYKKITTA